jgi:hypothetical protein
MRELTAFPPDQRSQTGFRNGRFSSVQFIMNATGRTEMFFNAA